MYNQLHIEMERERNYWNVWLWQPLLLLFCLVSLIFAKINEFYWIYVIMILVFSVMTMFYMYINFFKPVNKIHGVIRNNILNIVELDNPFSPNLTFEINGLNWLWVQEKRILKIRLYRRLKCLYGEKTFVLVRMNSFWFGKLSNDSVQELIFYLAQHNPMMVIDEKLNEVEL